MSLEQEKDTSSWRRACIVGCEYGLYLNEKLNKILLDDLGFLELSTEDVICKEPWSKLG